jgi:ankyrin repeat protein
VVDGQGFSPLFYACEMGHADVVRRLHAGRARMEYVDEEGRTYLHWATAGSHTAVVDFLLRSATIGEQVAV